MKCEFPAAFSETRWSQIPTAQRHQGDTLPTTPNGTAPPDASSETCVATPNGTASYARPRDALVRSPPLRLALYAAMYSASCVSLPLRSAKRPLVAHIHKSASHARFPSPATRNGARRTASPCPRVLRVLRVLFIVLRHGLSGLEDGHFLPTEGAAFLAAETNNPSQGPQTKDVLYTLTPRAGRSGTPRGTPGGTAANLKSDHRPG